MTPRHRWCAGLRAGDRLLVEPVFVLCTLRSDSTLLRGVGGYLGVRFERGMLEYGRFRHGPFRRGLGDWKDGRRAAGRAAARRRPRAARGDRARLGLPDLSSNPPQGAASASLRSVAGEPESGFEWPRYPRILVALDETPAAAFALRHVVPYAVDQRSHLTLLTVVPDPRASSSPRGSRRSG